MTDGDQFLLQLNVGQMQNLLDVVKSRFHDSPLIWLKDLASYLNVRINPIHAPDPAFRGHPPLYPSSMLSNGVKNVNIPLPSVAFYVYIFKWVEILMYNIN